MKLRGLLPVLLLALLGCSRDDAPKETPKEAQLYQEQVQALEKAKALEKTLQDSATQQRKSIDEQSQ